MLPKIFLHWIALVPFAALAFAEDRPPRAIPDGRSPRERFLALIDRPRVPPNPEEKEASAAAGLREIRFRFDSEAGQRVPGLLLSRGTAKERRPVVIVLHGTGGNKDSLRPLLEKLADRGLIAVAIDGRHAGERTGGAKGSEVYQAAILETWKTGRGFPFLYDTVWDLLRLLDYLQSRDDVDPDRIAAVGFSKGGMELFLAAAADERIAAAVPCIGVQGFGWALEHDSWQSRVGTIRTAVEGAAADVGAKKIDAEFVRRFYARVVPGIAGEFDAPAMLPLIAPRPLLVINGELDDRTPKGGLDLAVAAAREAYARSNAADRFEFLLQPHTRHAVTPEAEAHAIDWLLKSLKEPVKRWRRTSDISSTEPGIP